MKLKNKSELRVRSELKALAQCFMVERDGIVEMTAKSFAHAARQSMKVWREICGKFCSGFGGEEKVGGLWVAFWVRELNLKVLLEDSRGESAWGSFC
jgi:hypothetical protein